MRHTSAASFYSYKERSQPAPSHPNSLNKLTGIRISDTEFVHGEQGTRENVPTARVVCIFTLTSKTAPGIFSEPLKILHNLTAGRSNEGGQTRDRFQIGKLGTRAILASNREATSPQCSDALQIKISERGLMVEGRMRRQNSSAGAANRPPRPSLAFPATPPRVPYPLISQLIAGRRETMWDGCPVAFCERKFSEREHVSASHPSPHRGCK